jgi:uncharacterized protein (UPF0264 family)
MSKWLASIQSLSEVNVLLPVLPDILDIKNPAQGALGALSVAEVRDIVKVVDKRCQTSATIGDLPMQAESLTQAIVKMAATGVDYVKVGIFPDRHLEECLAAMTKTIKSLKTPVIAVLFADNMPKVDCVPLLHAAGFKGVMVDTAFKNGLHLKDHWDNEKIAAFIVSVKDYDLLCGLAGALRRQDIACLQAFGADYLGFRSALCRQRKRTAVIELNLAEEIKQAINKATLAV